MDWITVGGLLDPSTVGLLILLAGVTSCMTAAFGIGGGALLLAMMASLVPISALIPLHALVQLGSNGNRAYMTRRYIDWRMCWLFTIGAVLGAVLASWVVVQLPVVVIEIAVALFILFLVWGTQPKVQELSSGGQILSGAFTTFISMFVGATGPLVAGFIHRHGYEKLSIIGTMAACMTVQHGLKIFVFSSIGFAFWEWLPLTLLMILSGSLGTWIGLKLLNRIPAERFLWIFKLVVTLMAVKLLWDGLAQLALG